MIADLILDTGADMSICRASLFPEVKFWKGAPVHLTGFGASGAFYPTAYMPVEVGHLQFELLVAVVLDHLITAGALLGADLGDTVFEELHCLAKQKARHSEHSYMIRLTRAQDTRERLRRRKQRRV